MSDDACFLCHPPADLVYAESDSAFALCGLGPIVPSYSVVATRRHAASAADVTLQDPSFTTFAELMRSFLAKQYDTCLMTEHGRMPVCVGPAGQADPHCFHAHFLLFPAAPPILSKARLYFATETISASLADALKGAIQEKEYLLVSPVADEVSIFLRPGRLIPQFARKLVADAINMPQLTNWRRDPRREEAIRQATFLRERMLEHVL